MRWKEGAEWMWAWITCAILWGMDKLLLIFAPSDIYCWVMFVLFCPNFISCVNAVLSFCNACQQYKQIEFTFTLMVFDYILIALLVFIFHMVKTYLWDSRLGMGTWLKTYILGKNDKIKFILKSSILRVIWSSLLPNRFFIIMAV